MNRTDGLDAALRTLDPADQNIDSTGGRARTDLYAILAQEPTPMPRAGAGSAVRAIHRPRRTVGARDISLAAGAVGPDVVGVAYRSRSHGDVTATVSGGRFALWFPGDELADAAGGVEVGVTYRSGQTGTSRLTL